MSGKLLNMPGGKGLDTRQHVQLTVLTESERRGWVNPHLSLALMKTVLTPENWYKFKFNYVPINAVHPVDAARNLAVETMQKLNADWLVMFDNDIGPPLNFIDVIAQADDRHDIIVLPYYVWSDSLYPMICVGRAGDGTMITPAPGDLAPGWNEIGAGGTGAMIIHRRVFFGGRIDPPPFRIPLDANKGQLMSEDIEFTLRAKKAGYRLWTHTDFIASHFRTMDVGLAALGLNTILQKYTTAVQKKYGDLGIQVPDFNRVLFEEAEAAIAAENAEEVKQS